MHRGSSILRIIVIGIALLAGVTRLVAEEKPKAPPVAPIASRDNKSPAKPPMSPGEKLYKAKCGRCHDLPNPGFIAEETWNRWMMRMRYTAKLSDEDYDIMMDYARHEREARQAKKGK